MVFCTGKISELKRTTKINNIFSKERETREIIAGPILLHRLKSLLSTLWLKKKIHNLHNFPKNPWDKVVVLRTPSVLVRHLVLK